MSTLDKQIMISSYNNISFYSERRGAQDFVYYTDLLATDLESLGDNSGNYQTKFITKVMNIFHKQINCTSAFIVGPANYNMRRHEKSWNSRDKAYSDFDHWRDKYFKAVNRVRTLSPEAELDLIPQEIDRLEIRKEKFKQLKKCKTLEERGQLVGAFFPYLSDWDKTYLIENGVTYHIPSLTTKLRERKKKVLVMKARIEAKKNYEPMIFKGGSIFIENDRVIISHDEKPEREVITAIKDHGFRWSPKCKNWCRKHTANARYNAEILFKNILNVEVA